MKAVWQAMKALQKAQETLVRARVCVDVHIETDRPIGVAYLADMHLGNEGTDHEQIERDVKVIAETDGLYAMLGGDGVDNMILQSLFHASRENIVRPMVQYKLLEHILGMMKPKVLAVGDGNHNGWTKQLADIDLLRDIVAGWPVVWTAQCGIINLWVNDIKYVIYRQHKGRFNSAFNLTHTLKRAWEFGPENWDIGIGEHRHVPAIEPFMRHGEKKVAIISGTYKVYDQWAQSKGLWGARVGVPIVILWPDKKQIAVPDFFLDNMEVAVGYLKYVRGC